MRKRFYARITAILLAGFMAVSFLPACVETTLAAPVQTGAILRTEAGAETASQQLEDLFTTIDLMDATISELQAEMTAGHVTSQQLVQMYLDRIKAYDEKLKLNSIISINPNALSDAALLDAERSEGKVRGPLHGIPIVVKANYDVAGMATSAGCNALAHMISPDDAFVVQKLKDAGAVIIANTNMSEFAFSAANSSSTLGGTVHNAYDGTKTPAGSSGGTAVAVTCNFAAAGLGTDTGGSIRNPSSFSNLYGIRPSKGLTSISGVLPLGAQRDTTGPMARTAEDLALMLETMAGTDPNDDFTQEADADALLGDGYMNALSEGALKGKRIGYLANSFSFEVATYDEYGLEDVKKVEPNERVKAMINKARANLRKAGAEFVDLSELITEDLYRPYWRYAADQTSEYDMNKYLYEKGDYAPYKTYKELLLTGIGINNTNLGYSAENLADSFKDTVNPYTETVGNYKRGATWADSLQGREEISQILKENNIDAVMYLSYFNAAPSQADVQAQRNWDGGPALEFYFGSALGLPDISIPMGFCDSELAYEPELPLGLNLFSSFGNEKTLMEIAYAYEQQAGDYIRKMPERTPALPDQTLNDFLENLMEQVYLIDYSKYNEKPAGKVQLMLEAYQKAVNVNTQDPYAVYQAAKTLARAYDRVIKALNDSGLAPVPKVKSLNKITKVTKSQTVKYSKLKKKKQSFRIKATVLGKAKTSFKKISVTKAAKKFISVTKSGKVTIKRGLKKGKYTLKVLVTAGETTAYKKTSVKKTIKIIVK